MTDDPVREAWAAVRPDLSANTEKSSEGEHFPDDDEQAAIDRLLAGVRDGAWLDKQTFPALRYAVPGLIPEGFSLLVGPPKVGKSWLALALQLAVAAGGHALGKIPVGPPRRVLYLALEDGDRRMQDRCRHLLGHDPIPPLYAYLTRVEPPAVVRTIEAYLTRHPDTALVVIDTLGKVMPPPTNGDTTYSRDYKVGGRLKAIADARPGLAVVALHHDRKAGSDDFVERVSGTHGLAGSADTIVVLSRDRQSTEGMVQVTGRDVPEGEYAISLTGVGTWTLDGRDLAESAKRAEERKVTAGLGDKAAEVVQVVNDHPEGISPSDVAAITGMDTNQARVYLGRAVEAGRIAKPKRGRYTPVASVASVAFPPSHNTSNTVSESGDYPEQPKATEATQATGGSGPATCACGAPLTYPGEIDSGVCIRCRRRELDAG